MFVEGSNIRKSYGEGGSYVQVLKGVSVGVEKGDMCVIQGTSGSGKSTLLNCIGGLDEVDAGSIKIDGEEIVGLKGEKLSDYRTRTGAGSEVWDETEEEPDGSFSLYIEISLLI